MNNEIPYIDKSSGETIEYYFCQNTEENANTQAMHRSKYIKYFQCLFYINNYMFLY